MKYGMQMVKQINELRDQIVGMHVNGHETEGFLRLTLENGKVVEFLNWDQEDQGLYGCLMAGEPWDPSKLGIPSNLTVKSGVKAFEIKADKKLEINVNNQSLSAWGSEKSPGVWKPNETPAAKPEETNDKKSFGGMKKGFLG